MNKSSFISLAEQIEGFEIINKENAPANLTPQILWDLWDIGAKFGTIDKKCILFKQTPLYMELYDHRGNKLGGCAGFVVAKARESSLMNEGVYLFELRNGMYVIWDKGFSISDAQNTIKEIDEFAVSEGDKVNDKRIALFEDEQATDSKFSVVDIFREKDAVMPIFPDMDPQQVLNDFDHPELLDIIEIGDLKSICLKSEKKKILKDRAAKIRKLKGMGITVEDIAKMSAKEILTLREKL
jgi:hypothetical protein